MTNLKTQQFKSPGIVFDGRTGEEFDLTNIILVSKNGDVFKLPREHKGKYMAGGFAKCRPNKTNHCQTFIIDENGKKRWIYVHRLVAHAWLKREPYQRAVMHLDDNPLNNNVKNLRWCTHLENTQDMISKDRHNFYGKEKACSDETMLQIWKMGRGGLNMKPRHIYELYPHMKKVTLYQILSGVNSRLKRYLKNNLV